MTDDMKRNLLKIKQQLHDNSEAYAIIQIFDDNDDNCNYEAFDIILNEDDIDDLLN